MIGGDDTEDVMDTLLNARDGYDNHPALEELNCLIYRGTDGATTAPDEPERDQPSWKAQQDNVSVQIWETKANIRIKVASEARENISMNRIAKIAVQAIMDELKKGNE